MTKKLERQHIVIPRNHYTTKPWWNEIAYAEGMGGLLGVRVLQAVEIDRISQSKEMVKRAEKILAEIPKEQRPDMEKLLYEINKLSDYCNAWADEERYVERSDDGRRIGVDLSMVEYSKYKRLDGEWGEVWLDGYQRCIDDVYKRINAIRLLANIVNISTLGDKGN